MNKSLIYTACGTLGLGAIAIAFSCIPPEPPAPHRPASVQLIDTPTAGAASPDCVKQTGAMLRGLGRKDLDPVALCGMAGTMRGQGVR